MTDHGVRPGQAQGDSPAAFRWRPAGWLYWPAAALSRLIFRWVFGARFRCDPAIRSIKGPLLILGNHPSYFDPFLMAAVFFPRRICFLASHGFFRNRTLRFLLRRLAVIPKTQFRTDTQALKGMLRVIRSGGTLAVYPEGQRSLDGSRQPVDEAIGKMVHKLGCPVALVKENGGYLTWPRWSRSRWRRGRIEVRASLLFTPEQSVGLEAAEIQARIEKALEYQDYVWQRSRNHPFKSAAPALGLDALCHRCPACGRDLAMLSGPFDLTCRFCGNQIRMDRYGFMETIGFAPGFEQQGEAKAWSDPWQWHRWQIADMTRRFEKPNYQLTVPAAVLRMADDGSTDPAGHGQITITADQFCYDGESADPSGLAPLHLSVPIRNRSGISADFGQQFEITLAEGSFRFVPDDGQTVILIADALAAVKKA